MTIATIIVYSILILMTIRFVYVEYVRRKRAKREREHILKLKRQLLDYLEFRYGSKEK